MSESEELRARLRALPPDLAVGEELGRRVERTARRRRTVRRAVGSGVLATAVVAGGLFAVPQLRSPQETVTAEAPATAASPQGGPAADSAETRDRALSSAEAGPVPMSALAPCPDDSAWPDVPAEPPTGLSPDRLVPVEPADAGLLCAYRAAAGEGGPRVPLVTERRLTPAELQELAARWSAAEVTSDAACQGNATGTRQEFLIRFDYPDGSVWVATPAGRDGCTGATNGRLATTADLAADVRRVLESAGGPTGTP